MVSSFPLPSRELPVSMKENPDRKKIDCNSSKNCCDYFIFSKTVSRFLSILAYMFKVFFQEVYKFYQGIRFIRIMQLLPGVLPSHKCFNELISLFIRIFCLLFVIRNHTVTTPQKMTNSVTPA